MKIGIIGLGVIGGSLAKALRTRTRHEVVGMDLSAATVEAACASGAVQAELTVADLSACHVLILAVPPKACLSFLRAHASQIAPDTLVVDCCGVKRSICKAGFEAAEQNNFHFVGGHPMAGREVSGFQAALGTLFDRAVMLLVPKAGESEEVLRRAEELFLAIGFGRIVRTTAKKHDELIAITSQLAHLVSNAYVKSPRAGVHHGFSAGSFADLTRVARLDEKLWTELFLENNDFLIQEIDELMNALRDYREAIADKDVTRLCALLKKGRECKEQQDEHR
jgi:prephenate dehydrogenase